VAEQIERVRVRRADEHDAAGIARVHVDSWQASYLGLLPASFLNRLTVPDQTARWRRILRGATTLGSRTWVLSVNDRVRGFSSAGPTRDTDDDVRRVGEIYTLYLSPRVWGRGYGAELFEAVQDDLAARGFRTATLWVLEGNARARRFYEQAGFERDGARRPVYLETSIALPEIRYQRGL
jgi:ribosomal protein S18 acetylase RimI-like enzyme